MAVHVSFPALFLSPLSLFFSRRVSSNTLSRISRFLLSFLYFSSHKKRHLVQTITPVPGAIGHQQRVKAAAITNSDSLIPFILSPRTLSLSLSLVVSSPSFSSFLSPRTASPASFLLHSFSHFPFSAPRSFSPSLCSLARSRATPLCSPAPFTFAHHSRKSNFVTRAASSIS